MKVVWHEAPGEEMYLGTGSFLKQKRSEGLVVIVAKEYFFFSISSAKDVIKAVREVQSGRSRHHNPPCLSGRGAGRFSV